MERIKSNTKLNRFYTDLKCHDDVRIDNIKDMHTYKNSHPGALDNIPYNDQEDFAYDDWNRQVRDFDMDVHLNDPELSKEAEDYAADVSKSWRNESTTDDELNENVTQFEMFSDMLFNSLTDLYGSKPNSFRDIKRLANRMSEENFSDLVDRKIRDEVMAESLKAFFVLLKTD